MKKEINEINSTYKLLLHTWNYRKNNVSKYDQDILRKYNKDGIPINLDLSYFYQTHLYPDPWLGNIKDPEIIVLALNPSYDPINDEVDEVKIKNNFLEENLGRKDSDIPNWYEDMKGTTTLKWWLKRLESIFQIDSNYNNNDDVESFYEKLFLEDLRKNSKEVLKTNLIKKIGIFNLCGYHSKQYTKIASKCFLDIEKSDENSDLKNFFDKFNSIKNEVGKSEIKYKKDCLPTQNALILHLNEITKTAKYIIFIWGSEKYEKMGLKTDEITSKSIVVNKWNSANKDIKNLKNIVTYKDSAKTGIKDITDYKKWAGIDDLKEIYVNYLEKLTEIINSEKKEDED